MNAHDHTEDTKVFDRDLRRIVGSIRTSYESFSRGTPTDVPTQGDRFEKKAVKRLETKTAEAAAQEPKDVGSTRTSISLYGTDTDRINEVMKFMLNKGRRISASNAIQLCLRSAKLDDGLVRLLETIRKEDNRRKR